MVHDKKYLGTIFGTGSGNLLLESTNLGLLFGTGTVFCWSSLLDGAGILFFNMAVVSFAYIHLQYNSPHIQCVAVGEGALKPPFFVGKILIF